MRHAPHFASTLGGLVAGLTYEIAQWRAQLEEPTDRELMGATVPERPADASNWAEWARLRWPTLR